MSVDSPQILCTVRLVPSNNYFIKLPRSLSSLTVTVCDVPVVQLLVSSNTGRSLYCTVGGRVSDSSTDVVEASPKVGLEDQEVVVVRRPPESLLGQAVKVVVLVRQPAGVARLTGGRRVHHGVHAGLAWT